MQIKCEQCKTEYTLDEKLLSTNGTPVRCTHCGNVFKAFPPSYAPAQTSHKPHGQGVTAQAKNTTRQPTMSGAAAKFSDPAPAKSSLKIRAIPSQRNTDPPPPLKKSIPAKPPEGGKKGDKKLSEASRKSLEMGRTLISSVPPPAGNADVASAPKKESFTTAKTAKQTALTPAEIDNALASGRTIRQSLVMGETIQATAATPSVTPKPAVEAPSDKRNDLTNPPDYTLESDSTDSQLSKDTSNDEPDFSQVPATEEEEWSEGTSDVDDDDPDWTSMSSTMNAVPTFDEELEAPRRSRMMLFVITAVVILLGGGAAYMYFFQRDLLISEFGEVQDSKKIERLNTLLLEAREKVLLDTYNDYSQAEKKYLQVLAIDAQNAAALASLGQMYAIWAQYLLDAYLDALSDEEGNPNDETEQLKKEFETKLAAARRRVDEALKYQPDLKEAHIAAAEVDLLSENLEGAKKHLAKGRSESTVQGAGYLSAQIGIFENQNKAELIGMLKSIVVAEPLLRVIYRLARLQAADGKIEAAQDSLKQILQLNKKHTATLELQERLSQGKAVVLLPEEWISTEVAQNDSDTPQNTTEEANTEADKQEKSDKEEEGEEETMSIDRMVRKAATAQENGRTQEAVDLYNRALREEPNNVDALSGIAYTYLDRNNYGQAIAKFKRALGISSHFGPAIIGMAQTYKSMGQKAEALKWFKEYLDTNPGGRHAGMARRNVEELSDEAPTVTSESTVDASPAEATRPSAEENPYGESTATPSTATEDNDGSPAAANNEPESPPPPEQPPVAPAAATESTEGTPQ